MRHLDLFSGIGGFALAAKWCWGDEYETVAFCDNNKYCQELLKLRFPGVPIINDIKELRYETFTNATGIRCKAGDEREQRGTNETGRMSESTTNNTRIDLITGGFPCQPFSAAGKRKGTDDDRHLWPEMFRVISEFNPRWVIAENVRGILTIENGLVFQQVCLDLESIGYEVQPFVIPACAINAPHRRDRIWIVAYSKDRTNRGINGNNKQAQRQDRECQSKHNSSNQCCHVTDPCNEGLPGKERPGTSGERPGASRPTSECTWDANWIKVATEFCGVYDGLSNWLDGHYQKIIIGEEHGPESNPNRTKDLSILREAIQSGEISEQLRGLFQVEETEVLLKVLCRIQETADQQVNIQHQGKESQAKDGLRDLWQGANFMHSPYRREYQEQFANELIGIVPGVSFETALEVAKVWDRLQCAYSSLESPAAELDGFKLSKSGHRVERLKGLGNSIVPQVAFKIMQAIKEVVK